MKKVFLLSLAACVFLSLAGCGRSAGTGSEVVEGSVSELLSQVTKDATDPEMDLTEIEIAAENFSQYLFIDPIEGAEAAASEPFIGSIPHSAVLLRVPDSVNAEQVRADIEANLNPRKWVCVEAEKSAVLRRGNLILLVMSDSETVDKMAENFRALGK